MFVLSPLFQTRSRCINLTFLYTLVRSGHVYPAITAGTFRGAGLTGHYWSSLASSTRYDGSAIPSGYNLGFDASTVYPSNGPYERWLGFPSAALVLY